MLADLGQAGYWGLLVDKEYGGSGAPFSSFAPFLTRMATRRSDRRRPGLGARLHRRRRSVRTFGNAEQKQRFLPKLASGARLSAFALTEPCAGTDLTALRTTARLRRRRLRRQRREAVHHQRRARPDDRPGLPDRRQAGRADRRSAADRRTSTSSLRKYGLYALKHTYNRGIIFNDFRVPAENLLTPPRGDGLTIAYHGLNLGRVALCANAAGTMRLMMASMIPWAKFRRTYGAADRHARTGAAPAWASWPG